MKRIVLLSAIAVFILLSYKSFCTNNPKPVLAAVINVPSDYPTIKAAVNAANDGDVILLSHGTYTFTETLVIDKNITLASEFLNSNNESDIDLTIITSNQNLEPLIVFDTNAKNSKCIGITFIEAVKQVSIECDYMEVTNCKFYESGSDAVSFEGGGGYVGYNYFENCGDEAIDADNSLSWIVEYNTIINPEDDGIEFRLHNNNKAERLHIIRYNFISGADEDGIQLIDYDGDSGRELHIHHNVIINSTMVGLGCTEDGNTVEDFNGSDMVEKTYVYNNTFDTNDYGITGSNNMLVFNNIISNSSGVAIKKLDNNSKADYNDLFNNTTDFSSASSGSNNIFVDPLFNTDFSLDANSPCIDNGITSYSNSGLSHTVAASDILGSSPDMGAKEFDGGSVSNVAPTVSAGTDQVIIAPTSQLALAGLVTDDGLPNSGSLTLWSVESKPFGSNVSFSTINSPTSTATFDKQGAYELKLTADDGEKSSSDKVNIYYANDFNDSVINLSGSDYIEAEDYRYLVGSARVLNNSEASAGKIVNAEPGEGTWAYTEHRLVTFAAGTYYVWINASGPDSNSNGLKAAFNNLDAEIPFDGTVTNSFDDASWVKVTFNGIPEGVYPLRIYATEEGVSWDRIFVTMDSTASPNDILDTDEFSEAENIQIYPNPVKNKNINIQLPQAINISTIKIYDSIGNEIFTQEIESSKSKLNLTPNLPTGIYIIKVNTVEKGSISRKIIIE